MCKRRKRTVLSVRAYLCAASTSARFGFAQGQKERLAEGAHSRGLISPVRVAARSIGKGKTTVELRSLAMSCKAER